MLAAWGGEPGDPQVDLSTDWDAGTLRMRISPTSHRRPHPLLARVRATDATVIAAAQAGWPVILRAWQGGTGEDARLARLHRETLLRADHAPEVVSECLAWLGFYVGISIADTEAEAQPRYEEHVRVGGSGPTPGRHGVPEAAAEEWTRREVGRARFSFVGSPDTVGEHLLSLRQAGIGHVRVSFVETYGRPEQAAESFQIFRDKVLPTLDPQPLPEPPRYQESRQTGGRASLAGLTPPRR